VELPRVDPVGLEWVPPGYRSRARGHPPLVRWLAAAVLGAFAAVGTATTVSSLGRYCLTSHGANTAALPGGRR